MKGVPVYYPGHVQSCNRCKHATSQVVKHDDEFYVQCTWCGIRTDYHGSPERAASAWNDPQWRKR